MDWVRKKAAWSPGDRDMLHYESRSNTILKALESDSEPSVSDGLASDGNWNDWFQKTSLSPASTTEAGIVLLLAGRPEEKEKSGEAHNPQLLRYLPFSRGTFDTIIDSFFVHGSVAKVINRGHAIFSRTHVPLGDNGEPTVVYNVRTSAHWPSDLVLSMTYFPSRGLTYAILYGCTEATISDLRGRIKNAEGAVCHPLLLPGILAELERNRQRTIVRRDLLRLIAVASQLSEVQPEDWDVEAGKGKGKRKRNSGSSGSDGEDEGEGGPESAANAMDSWMEVHHLKNGLQNWQSQLREMVKHIEELDGTQFAPITVPAVGEVVDGVAMTQAMVDQKRKEEDLKLRQKVAGLRIRERLEEIIAEYEEHIRDCILNMDGMALATELAHTKANMAIALSAKHDGSQMKSIALLTMVFLPGTFMATFFSMTFFEWNPKDGEPVVSSNIWIYVLVTATFTLGTVGAWNWFANNKRQKFLPIGGEFRLRRKRKST